MKAIRNIISRLAAWLKRPFRKAEARRIISDHEQLLNLVSKADNAIYKSIVTQLKNDPGVPAHGADVRLLHRRLAQYERLIAHGSLADQDRALRRLEKQWRKVESRHHRKEEKDISRVRRAPEAGPPGRLAGLS